MKPRKLIGGQRDDSSARDRRASGRERYGTALRRDERTGELSVQIDPQGALAVDPTRGLSVRVGEGLQVSSASPYAIRALIGSGMRYGPGGRIEPNLSSTVQVDPNTKQLVAKPTGVDVTVTSGGAETDLQSWMNRLELATVTIGKAEHYTRQFLLMGA